LGDRTEDNAVITRDILRGRPGPKRDIVCLNAAPALVAGRKARTLQEGFRLAQQTIDTGAAMNKLDTFIDFTNKV
jgi:anthranilate phosphoribosyltransferase